MAFHGATQERGLFAAMLGSTQGAMGLWRACRRSLDINFSRSYARLDELSTRLLRPGQSLQKRLQAAVTGLVNTGTVEFACITLVDPTQQSFGVAAICGPGAHQFPPLLTLKSSEDGSSSSDKEDSDSDDAGTSDHRASACDLQGKGSKGVRKAGAGLLQRRKPFTLFPSSSFLLHRCNWSIEDVAKSGSPWWYDCTGGSSPNSVGQGLPKEATWLKRVGMQSVLTLPCLHQGKVYGVLTVASRTRQWDQLLLQKLQQFTYTVTPFVVDASRWHMEPPAMADTTAATAGAAAQAPKEASAPRSGMRRFQSMNDIAASMLDELTNLDKILVASIALSESSATCAAATAAKAAAASEAVSAAAAAATRMRPSIEAPVNSRVLASLGLTPAQAQAHAQQLLQQEAAAVAAMAAAAAAKPAAFATPQDSRGSPMARDARAGVAGSTPSTTSAFSSSSLYASSGAMGGVSGAMGPSMLLAPATPREWVATGLINYGLLQAGPAAAAGQRQGPPSGAAVPLLAGQALSTSPAWQASAAATRPQQQPQQRAEEGEHVRLLAPGARASHVPMQSQAAGGRGSSATAVPVPQLSHSAASAPSCGHGAGLLQQAGFGTSPASVISWHAHGTQGGLHAHAMSQQGQQGCGNSSSRDTSAAYTGLLSASTTRSQLTLPFGSRVDEAPSMDDLATFGALSCAEWLDQPNSTRPMSQASQLSQQGASGVAAGGGSMDSAALASFGYLGPAGMTHPNYPAPSSTGSSNGHSHPRLPGAEGSAPNTLVSHTELASRLYGSASYVAAMAEALAAASQTGNDACVSLPQGQQMQQQQQQQRGAQDGLLHSNLADLPGGTRHPFLMADMQESSGLLLGDDATDQPATCPDFVRPEFSAEIGGGVYGEGLLGCNQSSSHASSGMGVHGSTGTWTVASSAHMGRYGMAAVTGGNSSSASAHQLSPQVVPHHPQHHFPLSDAGHISNSSVAVTDQVHGNSRNNGGHSRGSLGLLYNLPSMEQQQQSSLSFGAEGLSVSQALSVGTSTGNSHPNLRHMGGFGYEALNSSSVHFSAGMDGSSSNAFLGGLSGSINAQSFGQEMSEALAVLPEECELFQPNCRSHSTTAATVQAMGRSPGRAVRFTTHTVAVTSSESEADFQVCVSPHSLSMQKGKVQQVA